MPPISGANCPSALLDRQPLKVRSPSAVPGLAPGRSPTAVRGDLRPDDAQAPACTLPAPLKRPAERRCEAQSARKSAVPTRDFQLADGQAPKIRLPKAESDRRSGADTVSARARRAVLPSVKTPEGALFQPLRPPGSAAGALTPRAARGGLLRGLQGEAGAGSVCRGGTGPGLGLAGLLGSRGPRSSSSRGPSQERVGGRCVALCAVWCSSGRDGRQRATGLLHSVFRGSRRSRPCVACQPVLGPGSGHKTGVGQPRVSGGGPAGSVPRCPSPEGPEGMREERAGARRLPHPCLVQLLLKHTCCSLHLPGSLSVSLPTPPSLSPPLSPHPSLPGTKASLPSVRLLAVSLSPLECRSLMAVTFCCLHRSPRQLGLCGGPRAVPGKCLWGEGTGGPQRWPASAGRTPPVPPTLLTSCPVCH